MKNKIDKIFNDVVSVHQLSHVKSDQSPEEENLNKSDNFVRRGIMLATLGGLTQHAHNEIESERQRPRETASIETPSEKIENTPEQDERKKAQKDAFSISAKNMPMSRNLARKTIKENPELSEAHGYLLHISPSAFQEVIDNNPKIKQDIASYHYDKLFDLHQGDQQKIFDSYRLNSYNHKKK